VSDPDAPDSARLWFAAKIAAAAGVLGFGGMPLVGVLPLPKFWRVIIAPEVQFLVIGLLAGSYWDHPDIPEEARKLGRFAIPAAVAWLLVFNLVRFG